MRLKRPVSEALDGILGDQIPVLDKGFVSVVDYMGDDSIIATAARVSYGGSTKTAADDARLIRRLMRDRHTSPFEMCEIRLHIRLPIFVARQFIRHRTASVNELSARYTEVKDDFYLPDADAIRLQSKSNKQGSEGVLQGELGVACKDLFSAVHEAGNEAYKTARQFEVSRELARIVLPLSTYTEWHWKIDLHNLLHFLELRSAPDAQQEIREYAEVIAQIVKGWVPVTYAAWLSYRKGAVTFSKEALEALIDVFEENGVFKNEMETALEGRSVGKSEINDVLAKLGL